MNTKTLLGTLKIVDKITNASSLTPLYRSVQINKNSIKACSEYGNIHLLLDEDSGLQNDILIDAGSLLAVATSLPSNSDITLEEKPNKVAWTCGQAKGILNSVSSDYLVPDITHSNFPWTPPQDFCNALLLASTACQAAAVSLGLYGISVEPDGEKLHMISSNSISLAATTVEKGSYPVDKVTIRPPVPGIIAALLSACPNTTLDIDKDGLFIQGDWLKAHLPLGQPLEHDLKAIVDQYSGMTQVAQINSIAVKKFVTRARSLTEKKQNFNVSVKVEEGKLVLIHEAIGASSEEWMLCEGLDSSIKYDIVTLPGDLLLLPLEFCQFAIFDYLKDSQIVLRGNTPDFAYVLGGS